MSNPCWGPRHRTYEELEQTYSVHIAKINMSVRFVYISLTNMFHL